MRDREAFFRPIAHRGLYDRALGRVENTPQAFLAAIAAGVGIECDLQPGADGLPLVFHDETLDRLMTTAGAVSSVSQQDLASLTYRDSTDRIITFEDILDLVAGKVPLLVEIKSDWSVPRLDFLQAVALLAARYRGPLALMSFDPAVMTMIKELAPAVSRGIVSGSYDSEGWWHGTLPQERKVALRDLLESRHAEPEFYAFEVGALPTPVTRFVREVLEIPLFAWTVRTAEDRLIAQRWADASIFEGAVPIL